VRYPKGLATPTYSTSIQSHSAGAFVVPWSHVIAAPWLLMAAKILEYSHHTTIGPDCLSIQVRDEGSAITISRCTTRHLSSSNRIVNYNDQERDSCNPCSSQHWPLVNSHSHLVQACPDKYPIHSVPWCLFSMLASDVYAPSIRNSAEGHNLWAKVATHQTSKMWLQPITCFRYHCGGWVL